MADPYLPPNPAPVGQDRTPRDTIYTEKTTTREVPASTDRTSAFGTGMLVALVFVIVAILAAVLYQRSDPVVQQPAPAAETAPAATVDPVAPAEPAPAPAETAVEPDAPAEPVPPAPAPPAADTVEP